MRSVLLLVCALPVACGAPGDGEVQIPDEADADVDTDTDTDEVVDSDDGPLRFIVFGDLNGGGCEKNDRLNRLMALMVDADADLYLQTGDLIDGYGDTSCFASDPGGCSPGIQGANMAEQFSPLLTRAPRDGLEATFYPIIGNHDDNWGSGWYPDPCGEGICEFLGMDTSELMSTYLTHGPLLDGEGLHPHSLDHGDVCSLESSESGHPDDFFYSFDFRGSTFIVLKMNDDNYGMLSCNGGHPGFDSCEEYCGDLGLLLDADRHSDCYDVEQYDWLVGELRRAQTASGNIFVFAHAPLLGNGDSHLPTAGNTQYRALLEQYDVDIYFNGHNHAYERTHAVRGDQLDPTGTAYITTGVGGALTDGTTVDWFTAATYSDWTTYADAESMTTYLEITVDGPSISGRVISLGDGLVDEFSNPMR